MRFRVSLFNVYFVLITLLKSFGADAGTVAYVIAFLIGCMAIAMKMLRERYTKSEMLSMLFILGIGLLNFLIGRSTTILFTAITICGLKNVDIDRTIRLAFWTRLTGFLCMILGSLLGIIENSAIDFYRSGRWIERYAFGYKHPNTAHMALAILILLALYLFESKMRPVHYIALLGINYFFYRFTYSRTGFFVVIISVALFACTRTVHLRNAVMRILRHSYWVLFAITVLGGLLYGKVRVLYGVNGLLTGRVNYIHKLFKLFLPPLVGSQIYNNYVNIDNGYIAMLYEGGVLAFLWISYYVTKVIKRLYDTKEYTGFMLMISFIIYNMAESFYPSISVNISLLLIGRVLFQSGGSRVRSPIDNFHADI